MKVFKDSSTFSKGILIVFLLQSVVLFFIYNKNKDNNVILYIIALILIIGFFFSIAKVQLEINSKHIKFGLFPLPKKVISWNDIKEIKVIKISAYTDFLGIGLRYSKKYGKGYVTDSSNALFLKRKNGKKFTISIKDKTKLELFLKQISEN